MQKKLSIISFSGDFDKLTAVFTLATGAAAVGCYQEKTGTQFSGKVSSD